MAAIYVSIMTNTQVKRAAATVPAAAIAAGLSSESAAKLLPAFGLGATALQAIPGMASISSNQTKILWLIFHRLRISSKLPVLLIFGAGLMLLRLLHCHPSPLAVLVSSCAACAKILTQRYVVCLGY